MAESANVIESTSVIEPGPVIENNSQSTAPSIARQEHYAVLLKDPKVCKNFLNSACVYGSRCRFDHPHYICDNNMISRRLDVLLTAVFDISKDVSDLKNKYQRDNDMLNSIMNKIDDCLLCNTPQSSSGQQYYNPIVDNAQGSSRRQRGRGRPRHTSRNRSSSRDRLKQDIQNVSNKEIDLHKRLMKAFDKSNPNN